MALREFENVDDYSKFLSDFLEKVLPVLQTLEDTDFVDSIKDKWLNLKDKETLDRKASKFTCCNPSILHTFSKHQACFSDSKKTISQSIIDIIHSLIANQQISVNNDNSFFSLLIKAKQGFSSFIQRVWFQKDSHFFFL